MLTSLDPAALADAARRALAAGFDIVAWEPRVLAVSDPLGDTFLGHTWPSYRKLLDRLGTVPTADLDRFDRLCTESSQRGTFSVCVTRHAWLAHSPGGSQ